MSNIGLRIKEARELNGWTQEELAQKMGYKSKSTINKIELGKNDVSQSNIKKFAEVLHVQISYLMDIDDEEEQKELEFEIHEVVKNIMKADGKLKEIIELDLTYEETERLYEYAVLLLKARDR